AAGGRLAACPVRAAVGGVVEDAGTVVGGLGEAGERPTILRVDEGDLERAELEGVEMVERDLAPVGAAIARAVDLERVVAPLEAMPDRDPAGLVGEKDGGHQILRANGRLGGKVVPGALRVAYKNMAVHHRRGIQALDDHWGGRDWRTRHHRA